MTRVYAADTAPLSDPLVYSRLYASVSETRRRKTDRLCFDKDKRLSLGAEYLFMAACRDLGLDYQSLSIETDKNRKPYIAGSPFFFNLSHSGERVMCIMSSFPVGCDVEKIDKDHLSLAERFFTAEECSLIASGTTGRERADTFCRIWTLKESFLKCTGSGLYRPLNAFSVLLTQDGPELEQSADDGCYRFAESDPGDGYRYAWCIGYPCETKIEEPEELRFVTIE